jgi:hypothetical protein
MRRVGKTVRTDDEVRDTPGAVVWAAAAGTAPLPFLAVYAVMFIIHGGIHPVAPPDITGSRQGELAVGVLALVLFVIALTAMLWLLGGRRRWPFVLVQSGMLGAAIDFLVDDTKGGRPISAVVAVAAAVALVCAVLPSAWEYFGQRPPALRRRRPAEPAPDPAGIPAETVSDPQRV